VGTDAIGPIDGRYRRRTELLADFFSERALIKYRIIVEVEYLISLSENPKVGLRKFSEKEKDFLRQLGDVSSDDVSVVKDIEIRGHKGIKPTNHDMKAIEYYVKERMNETSLKDSIEWVHFALTSEDVNNMAYAMMLSDGVSKVILPPLSMLHQKLDELALRHKDTPMLARTHGQPASPTTFGKEFRVFSSRLKRQIEQLETQKILVKLNGATGNYNAHHAAYPEINWPAFTKDFVAKLNDGRSLKLEPNLITTQIEPRDSYAELFDNIRRMNIILIDFSQDLWRYISDGWVKQKPVEGEAGSSTMPHKVNPIDFENCEGNLGIANALLTHFSTKLPISRLQRDLSDSTVSRNYGVALGHCLVAYNSVLKGLGKVAVDEVKISEELQNHPEVISEAIQTILRCEGVEMPYERLKEMTRGKAVTMEDFLKFIDSLDVSDEVKAKLRQISPQNYTGIASDLAATR